MERPHPQVASVKITNPLAIYTSNCNSNVKFYNRLSVLTLGPKYMKRNILKFCFYFCFQYALIITCYDFGLSFLKITLKVTLYDLLLGKVYLLFYTILKQNDWSIFLRILCYKHCQSLL